MKIFKCDGHKFSTGEKCKKETEYEDEKGYPENWLTINGDIVNNSRNAHTIVSNKLLHFCSWECLYLSLYKDVSKLD